MSVVVRRTKSRIVYDVYYRDLHGKQRTKTFPRRKDADHFDIEMRARKARDEFPEIFQKKRRLTFTKLAHKWIDQHSRPFKSPMSMKRDEGVLRNHLLPVFGEQDVNRITSADVQKYISDRMNFNSAKTHRRVAPATINREIEIFRKILNDGIKWGDVKVNPCKSFKKLYEQRKAVDFLTENELVRLLQQSPDADRPLFACAIYTGMRYGELLNLKKSKVDLNHRMITVDIGSEYSNTTKSKKVRYIPIGTALYPYLAEVMNSEGEYMFPSKVEALHKRSDIRKVFRNSLRHAGIERHVRFHDLRHAFASHFVMRGGDLLALKEILGHSDLQMVQRYAHLAPEHLRNSIERLKF